MEICKDILTRYPHKISMFGYVWIHGYMEIHMDNIGYLMDISFGYLFFWISPSRRAKKISMNPNISVLIHAFIHIYTHILTYPKVQVPRWRFLRCRIQSDSTNGPNQFNRGSESGKESESHVALVEMRVPITEVSSSRYRLGALSYHGDFSASSI